MDDQPRFNEHDPRAEDPFWDSDIESRTVTVTGFPDEAAQELSVRNVTLPQLASGIRNQVAAEKERLPWLKLAVFGDKRSVKNCLRTNENVLHITGIEVEHDKGEIAFDTALAVMLEARLRCLLYTSPSYVPASKERWRILLPLSQNHLPETREKFVARINGLFGGKLAGESFTLSQAYFFGHVNNPHHRVEVIDGQFLDLRDDLFAGSIFKDGSTLGDRANTNGSGAEQHKSRVDDDPEPVDRDKIKAALDVISSDCSYDIWLKVAGALHRALGESGFEMFDQWSAKAKGTVFNDKGKPEPCYTPAKTRERWHGARTMTNIGIGTIFHYANQADPGWRDRFNREQSSFFRGASSAGNGSAGAQGAHDHASDFAEEKSLIKATPFVLRDPKLIPRRQWLYGNHLIRKFGSATIALGGIGKTSLMIVEALANVTGRALLGITPKQRSKVWLWNGEDPVEEIERRIAAACLHYGITPLEIEGGLFVDSGRDSEIVIATQTREGAMIAAPVIEALIKTIRDKQIDIVQIDPFISSHRVTENDNNAIDIVAKSWTRIADITNTAIDLSHHSRKTGGAEVTVEDGRGAIALLNAVRSARVLNTMTAEDAPKAGVESHRSYFKLANGKSNLAPPSETADWFHLQSIDLGNGPPETYFDGGDKVGVVTEWEWPDPLDGMTGRDFDKVAAAIRVGKWRKDVQARDWVGKAVAKALGLNLSNRADKAKVTSLIKVWLAHRSLVEVEGVDDQRKAKTFIEVAEED